MLNLAGKGWRVIGVDACAAGWVGISLGEGGAVPYFATRIDELLTDAAQDGPIEVVAIDMPIGLPDRGFRQADVLARQYVGPRRASVFMTPVRAALQAETHRQAVAINHRLAGVGVSIQAFALKPKILEVDQWVRHTPLRVAEVHPEVSFAHLAGGHLRFPKATWAGAETRRDLLAGAGIVLTGDLGSAGAAAKVDDILDATAAAWTAQRVMQGEAECLPAVAETFSDGLPCAIWA